MKIFFDTEFTGLRKNTTVISIGLINERGEHFYGESSDYDKEQVDEWIKANVLPKLRGCGKPQKALGEDLRRWIDSQVEKYGQIEWVSDVCHYDFVLLIDLAYGNALNMPYGVVSAACHDINQDIARYFDISEIDAFDLSREDLLARFNINIPTNKHSAMYDAIVIQRLYESMKRE